MLAGFATWLDTLFTVYLPDDADWPAESGVYVFAGLVPAAGDELQWHALYVGETQDLSDRLPAHERWSAAQRLGATHIHVRPAPDPIDRVVLQRMLIQDYQPPLNEKSKG